MKLFSKNKLEIFLVFFYVTIFIGIFYSCNYRKEIKNEQKLRKVDQNKILNSIQKNLNSLR